MKGAPARKAALEVLIKVDQNSAYANIALSAALERSQMSERDKAFITALVLGTLRNRNSIDEKLNSLASRPLVKMPVSLRNILRLSLFQLEQMPDIPASAVVNTGVDLARQTGHKGQAAFVNGLLRNYLRHNDGSAGTTPDASLDLSLEEKLARDFSMPNWLVKKWLKDWGEAEATSLLKFQQEPPALVLRTCTTAIEPSGLKLILENQGLELEQSKLVKACFIVKSRGKHKGKIENIPGYEDGMFAVQDEPSAFISLVLGPKPGELVYDLCAAPGSKTLHLAELMEAKGRVIAIDIHAKRLNFIASARKRLSLDNIDIIEADATKWQPERLADKVLIDAPCTGSGVIAKRSDARFTKSEPDLESLVSLQRALLNQGAKLAKPDGTIVYSTCSVEKEENDDNIEWFLANHSQYQEEKIELAEFEPSPSKHGFQFLPSRHGLPGYFVCKLKRIGS